jgi:7-cyano-7-deazaguanine synthase
MVRSVKALLLSGGLDSVALAYWKRPDIALTIDYGQRPAQAELEAAARVSQHLNIKHEIVHVDCASLGTGLLADSPALPGSPSPEWWPFRNQLLITLALMRLAGSEVDMLMLGTVASDGLHADGTPKFYETINALVAAQEYRPWISAPAIDLTTVELVQRSQAPSELLLWSHSCQVGNLACGQCRGCLKRLTVLQDLGLLED